MGRRRLHVLRDHAGDLEPSGHVDADARLAEGKSARDLALSRFRLRRQAVDVAAFAACRRGRASHGAAREARVESQDDVPERRPSAGHAAAHAPFRRCGRQAHFAASRLPESPRDPRRVRRKLRRSDARPLQHAEPAREFGDGATQCRFADRDARTGRRARPLRDRIGDGRARDQAESRPRRVPHSATSRRSTRAPACRFLRGI